MRHKTEVWVNNHKARAIRVFLNNDTPGATTIARYYVEISPNRAYTDEVDKYDKSGCDGLFIVTRAAIACGGSEDMQHDLSITDAEDLIVRFRKSARKSGFTKLGQYTQER